MLRPAKPKLKPKPDQNEMQRQRPDRPVLNQPQRCYQNQANLQTTSWLIVMDSQYPGPNTSLIVWLGGYAMHSCLRDFMLVYHLAALKLNLLMSWVWAEMGNKHSTWSMKQPFFSNAWGWGWHSHWRVRWQSVARYTRDGPLADHNSRSMLWILQKEFLDFFKLGVRVESWHQLKHTKTSTQKVMPDDPESWWIHTLPGHSRV